MNRQERRQMQKKLGLNKFYKTQTTEQRNERIRENQENGKRMMEDRARDIEVAQQEDADLKESDIVTHIAEDIAKKKKMPLIDAMVEAQEEYRKTKV